MTTTAIFGHGLFFSANGSTRSRCEPGGSAATPVSEPPKGTLIFALAFTAQPLASRMGPRFRLRSLSQARNIEGTEMASRMPMIASGTCHAGSLAIAPKMPPNAASNVVNTRPMAANVPVSILVFGWAVGEGGGDGGGGALVGSTLTTVVALWP